MVTAQNFLLATRDSGYKSSPLAIAELVDNSIQAGASTVDVRVRQTTDAEHPLEVLVTDDGAGMDAMTLASALSFGGSTRFDDRASLGRYGMGLPNGGLSRARRIEVFSWRGSAVLFACLDIDELIKTARRSLPRVRVVSRPDFVPESAHGTTVRLTRCDRLEYRRQSSFARRLETDLGRIYRRFLTNGLVLRLNDAPIRPADPLFLSGDLAGGGARQFGDVLKYRLQGPRGTGLISVVFSELPIESWHGLGSDEKRRRGVTGAAPVSIVRADREVDRGWFFMGSKRRENYDDWWRCEIRFDPLLDEHFGITNAKQAIRPSADLRALLEHDLEAVARALNKRVRHRFEMLKVARPTSAAIKRASKAHARLPVLPADYAAATSGVADLLSGGVGRSQAASPPYEIVVDELESTDAFDFVVRGSRLLLVLNSRHPLYRDLYAPLANSESVADQEVATRIALVLLAAAHAEAAVNSGADCPSVGNARSAWADVVAAFFNT